MNDLSGKRHALVGGMAWTMGAAVGGAVAQIVIVAILGRLLVPADFGVVATALVVANLASVLAQLGMNQAVVQRKVLEPGIAGTAFWLSISIALLAAGLVILLAPPLSSVLDVPTLTPILRTLAATFLIRALGSTAEALATRAMRFRLISLASLCSYVCGYGLVGVSFAVLGFGPWALAFGHLSQAAISSLVLLALNPHRIRPNLDASVVRGLFRFGTGMSIAQLANFVALQADNLVVVRTLGVTSVGMYSRAYQLMGMPASLIGQALDRVLFPTMSRLQDDRSALLSAYVRGLSFTSMLAMPLGSVLAVLAPEIVQTILGNQWGDVAPPFAVFALLLAFRIGDRLNAIVVRALGAVFRRAALQGVYAVAVVSGALFGSQFGIMGVALAVSVALFGNFLLGAALANALLRSTWLVTYRAVTMGVPSSVILASCALLIATVSRAYSLPAILTLFVAATVSVCLTLHLAWRHPGLFVGRDPAWFIESIGYALPHRAPWFSQWLARLNSIEKRRGQ